MDINQNTLIQSSDKLNDQKIIDQNPDNFPDLMELKNKTNINNNPLIPNLKLNLEFSSTKELKLKERNNNYLTQYQEEKSSDKNEIINNSSSITYNILIKSDIHKDKNSIGNNKDKKSISNSGYNENIEDESYRKALKKEKKTKLYKTYIINKRNNELAKALNLKLIKNKNDKEKINKLIINKNKDSISSDYNVYNRNENITLMHTINAKDWKKQMSDRTKEMSYNYIFNQDIVYKCLFCDKISENNMYNSLFNCEHFFCKKCGKTFYEEVIEIMIKRNNFNFIHCPIVNCPKEVSLSLLKLIISDNNYKELIKHLDKNNKENKNRNNKKEKKEVNIMSTENYEKNQKNQKNQKKIFIKNELNSEYYKYSQQNIIDVNSYQKYIYYIQKSFARCPSCKEYNLYGKIDGNYDKCLKCMKKYCKYCHKEFEDSHLDITKINHCKVFYRTYKSYIQQKIYFKFLFNLILVIGGYLFILTFFIIKIKRALTIRNIFKKIIIIILFFILFVIFFPIGIIILPYFPMIISL